MSMIDSILQNGELCSHRTDSFFRYHDSELTEVAECGEVDCPLGHATLRQVDSGDIAAYVSAHGDPWASVGLNLSPGWYIDVRDSDGTVWAFSYRGDGTLPEQQARADFVTFERAYHKWSAEYDEAERNERRSEQTATDEEELLHVNYPHHPGYLVDCPACEAKCHCTPDSAECVWEGHES